MEFDCRGAACCALSTFPSSPALSFLGVTAKRSTASALVCCFGSPATFAADVGGPFVPSGSIRAGAAGREYGPGYSEPGSASRADRRCVARSTPLPQSRRLWHHALKGAGVAPVARGSASADAQAGPGGAIPLHLAGDIPGPIDEPPGGSPRISGQSRTTIRRSQGAAGPRGGGPRALLRLSAWVQKLLRQPKVLSEVFGWTLPLAPSRIFGPAQLEGKRKKLMPGIDEGLQKSCQQKSAVGKSFRSARRKLRGIPFSRAAAPCAAAQNSIFL